MHDHPCKRVDGLMDEADRALVQPEPHQETPPAEKIVRLAPRSRPTNRGMPAGRGDEGDDPGPAAA